MVFACPVLAAERELDEDPAPGSVGEIKTPGQRVFPEVEERPPLFPWLQERLQTLPAFFADTVLSARYRTYYMRQDRTTGVLSEAWAMGGSLYYRSGWLKDLFAVEVEGFTSQPIHAPSDRGGTLLLDFGQDGYTALEIANGKLRYKGIVLTGYRQYLDLPYLNKQDSRMTPNTFESLTIAKPDGELRFSTGYTWKIKRRNSDEFKSMTEAIGIDKDRGLIHAGAVWDPSADFHVGVFSGAVPDVFAGIYTEFGLHHAFASEWETRLDGQFSYQGEIGDDLGGDVYGDAWNLGLRGAASYEGAVFRLGFSVTGPEGSVAAPYGTNPTYVTLMQRSFNRPHEKAVLVSTSYDFSTLGIKGLSSILNFVAGFDGESGSSRVDRQELDLTADYKIREGWFESFWLRVRGSWLHEEGTSQDAYDVRVILRYDFPVL
jgi:hypothetical protein